MLLGHPPNLVRQEWVPAGPGEVQQATLRGTSRGAPALGAGGVERQVASVGAGQKPIGPPASLFPRSDCPDW